MQNAVRERLCLYLKGKMSVNIAAELGYKPSTFSSKLSGARGLDVDFLSVVLNHYPDLSAEWLFRGVGSMEHTDDSTDAELKAMYIEQGREIHRLKQRIAELEGEKKDRA